MKEEDGVRAVLIGGEGKEGISKEIIFLLRLQMTSLFNLFTIFMYLLNYYKMKQSYDNL